MKMILLEYMLIDFTQQPEKNDSWPPPRGGCQRQLTGGVSLDRR